MAISNVWGQIMAQADPAEQQRYAQHQQFVQQGQRPQGYAFDQHGNSLPGGWMGQGREPMGTTPMFNQSGVRVTSPLDTGRMGPAMNMGNLDIRPAHLQNPQPTFRAAGEPMRTGWEAPPGMQFQPRYQPPANPNADPRTWDVQRLAISGLGGQDNWVHQTGNGLGVPPPTNFPTTNPGMGGAGGGGTATTPLPTDTPGGYGSNPGSPAFGAINTSITPTNIFTQQQTNRAINQRRALAAQASSLPWLLQQGARQGVSQRSPSAIGRAIPQIGAMQTEIARAPVEQQFADDAANIDHYRAGQVAREQEAQGLAGGLLRMQDMNRVLQGTRGSILSSLLSRFM